MSRRRFVMLDRDGTLIVERHYLSDPEAVELLPNAVKGLRRMRELGLGIVVITNQSAVGRGLIDHSRLDQIHGRLNSLLAAEGVSLDGIFFCPHLPEAECDCRKPQAALVHAAERDLGFDAREGFVIGDKPCDIELGRRVGSVTLLVRTGYGAATESEGSVHSDFVVGDLGEAAELIGRALRKE